MFDLGEQVQDGVKLSAVEVEAAFGLLQQSCQGRGFGQAQEVVAEAGGVELQNLHFVVVLVGVADPAVGDVGADKDQITGLEGFDAVSHVAGACATHDVGQFALGVVVPAVVLLERFALEVQGADGVVAIELDGFEGRVHSTGRMCV